MNVVINEAARKTLQLKVGDRVRVQFSQQEFTIRGIVRDFNFDSFHEPISPVAFMHNRNFLAYGIFHSNLSRVKSVSLLLKSKNYGKQYFRMIHSTSHSLKKN